MASLDLPADMQSDTSDSLEDLLAEFLGTTTTTLATSGEVVPTTPGHGVPAAVAPSLPRVPAAVLEALQALPRPLEYQPVLLASTLEDLMDHLAKARALMALTRPC